MLGELPWSKPVIQLLVGLAAAFAAQIAFARRDIVA
jgi:hypothetical protein